MGSACTTHERDKYKKKSENLKERDNVEGLGVGGKIILERILRK